MKCMAVSERAVYHAVETNCYCLVIQLKSDRELDKIKGLKLVELWLNRNPLCDLFKDQASYIRSVSDFVG